MRSELVSQEKNRIEIKVEFEHSEFSAELNKVFNDIAKRANIPGFRKGHVPRKTIEMRYGKNSIHDETIEKLLNESISEIIKDYDIEPLFAPTLKSRGAIVDGQPVSVNILIEAKPEIKLPEFQDIEVERLISVVDDSMIDTAIDNIRKSMAKFEAIDSPVQDDSVVSVEYKLITISPGGEEISRGKKNEMATINMQELTRDEFREPFLGKSPGDFLTVTIENDATGDGSNMLSASTRYEFKIIEVGKKVLPELTPEFFKICVGFDCETEESFKDAVADKILKKLQSDAEADAEARAIAIVAEKSGFDVPGSLVYREMEKIKALDERDAKERHKIEFKELLKLRGMEYDDYEKQVMVRAWGTVRNLLVIDEIGRKSEIKIEPQDLDEWISSAAEKEGVDAEQLKKAYYKDKDSVNLLVDRVFSDKSVKWLMDKITIKDVMQLTPPVVAETEEANEAETSEDYAGLETTETESNTETQETERKSKTTKSAKTTKKATETGNETVSGE